MKHMIIEGTHSEYINNSSNSKLGGKIIIKKKKSSLYLQCLFALGCNEILKERSKAQRNHFEKISSDLIWDNVNIKIYNDRMRLKPTELEKKKS